MIINNLISIYYRSLKKTEIFKKRLMHKQNTKTQKINSEGNSSATNQIEKFKTTNSLRSFLIDHLSYGLLGFSLFFLFALLIKFISFIFNSSVKFEINLLTILIGVAGFALAFGFSYLDSFKK